MRAAWEIADIVEQACAADRVRARGLRRGQNRKQEIAREYDPLAATCLAMLIESRMVSKATSASSVGISACGNGPDTPPETGTGTVGGR
jgi:hypothetical protein